MIILISNNALRVIRTSSPATAQPSLLSLLFLQFCFAPLCYLFSLQKSLVSLLTDN